MGDRTPQGPDVIAAKRDLGFLKQVLNLHSDRTSDFNSPCPVCQSSSAMQWGPDKTKHGEWYWSCNKCKAGGDIIEALTKAAGLSYADAFKKIREEYGGSAPKRQPQAYSNGTGFHANGNGNGNGTGQHEPEPRYGVEKPEPVLDHDLAEACIEKFHKHLLKNMALVKKWQRGLSQEVIERYRVGYCEMADVQGVQGKKMFVPGAWVLPITDAEHKLKGVKLHFEERPHWNKGECPKLLWAPFGTTPPYEKKTISDGTVIDQRPVHAYYGLWPHPSTLEHKRRADFSMDPQWYIERIQRLQGGLKAKFDDAYEANQLFLASERGVNTDGLGDGDLWDCKVKAFDEFKRDLMDAVIKVEDKGRPRGKTDWASYLFIQPGELKALATLSAGLMATAPTGGESWMPTAAMFALLASQKLCLFHDADPPKRVYRDKTDPSKGVLRINNTGIEWAAKWSLALSQQGASHVIMKAGGQRVRED